MGNTHFKHKSLYRYTRVTRGEDGMELMSMMVKKGKLHHVQNVRTEREEWDEASQIIMLYCIKLGWWIHRLRGERR